MDSFKLRYKFLDFAMAKRDYFLCFVRLAREQKVIGSVLRIHRCQIAVTVTLVEEAVRLCVRSPPVKDFPNITPYNRALGIFPPLKRT